jgi:hypothetical protein
MGSLDFTPTDKLKLSLSANYTIGESGMDTPHFSAPAAFLNGDQSSSPSFYIVFISSDGKTLDYTGYDEYSDLDYSIFDLTFNVSFDISETVGIYGVFNYTDYTDDEPYAYGDLDGAYYSANIGITYKF